VQVMKPPFIALARGLMVAVLSGIVIFAVTFSALLLYARALPVIGPVSLGRALTTPHVAKLSLSIGVTAGGVIVVLRILRILRPIRSEGTAQGFPVARVIRRKGK
jgi:hypothetical protein